jgi:peroxiredoxin
VRRLSIIFILIAGIAFIVMSAIHYFKRPSKGDIAPPFSLEEISGQSISLEEYRGKFVLLHFWATWCGTCRYELPAIENLNEKFKDSGLVVVSVLADDKAVPGLKQIFKITFPVLLDPEGAVADKYMVYGVPESFIIDPEGIIVSRLSGKVNWDSRLRSGYFDRLLKK